MYQEFLQGNQSQVYVSNFYLFAYASHVARMHTLSEVTETLMRFEMSFWSNRVNSIVIQYHMYQIFSKNSLYIFLEILLKKENVTKYN